MYFDAALHCIVHLLGYKSPLPGTGFFWQGIANLCTANNTIAIITTGPIDKDIAKRFHLDRRKTASILDTFSCLIQGIIPYGAQMLIAAGLAGISPLSIIGNLYYPFCMGACAILAILIRYPGRYS